MVYVNYGTSDSVRVSRGYISAAGHISILLVIATLMVMMVSTTYFVLGSTAPQGRIELESFDPVER